MPGRRHFIRAIAVLPAALTLRNALSMIAVVPAALTLGDALPMRVNRKPAPRHVMWRRVMDDMSFEEAHFGYGSEGPEITGLVLAAEKGLPLRVKYRIVCDARWQTRLVEIEQNHGGEQKSLRLERDSTGQWLCDGRAAPELSGCTDVDLSVSPSTNALPINRLHLAVGAIEEIRAAWVRFPDLTTAPAQQSYSRESADSYRYHSLSSGFVATINVDDAGLPLTYQGVWQRVATSTDSDEAIISSQAAESRNGFAAALISAAPAMELGDQADAFSWLVGCWVGDVRDFESNGTVRLGRGEWWFSWTLEGRAIQDVWIVPQRADRATPVDSRAANNRYGTSIRSFDRKSGLWHVTWINPVSGAHNELVGKRAGDRVELLGESDGAPIRWTFADIKADSFVWLGESQASDGTWRLDAKFDMRKFDPM